MAEKKDPNPIWLATLGLFIIAGLYTTFRIVTEGHGMLSSDDQLVWTMPIATYVFLALMSSGFTQMACFPDVFGLHEFKHLARRFSFLALSTLLAAFLALSLELGSVFKMVYFVFSPNLSSPIWWMGAIYSVELVFLIGKLVKAQILVGETNFISILASGVSILAPLMLGAVFSMVEARPVFFGLFMPVFFLVVSFLCGIAMANLHTRMIYSSSERSHDDDLVETLDEFAKAFEFTLGIAVILYAMRFVFKSTTFLEAFTGGFNLIPLVILVLSFVCIKTLGPNSLIPAMLALVGVFGCHLEWLFDGQSQAIGVYQGLFVDASAYWSNIWEWLIALFAISVMLLLFTLGEKLLDLEGT